MTLLDALNFVLRRIGEQPVTGLDVEYPTVTVALPAIEEARRELLLEEWWFNKFHLRYLQADQDGKVRLPDDALQAYCTDPRFICTGRYVRWADTGEHVNEDVEVRIVLDVPFEELPNQAQVLIRLRAAYIVYIQDFGEDSTAEQLRSEVSAAYTGLAAQHTRARRYNTRQKVAWRSFESRLRN